MPCVFIWFSVLKLFSFTLVYTTQAALECEASGLVFIQPLVKVDPYPQAYHCQRTLLYFYDLSAMPEAAKNSCFASSLRRLHGQLVC